MRSKRSRAVITILREHGPLTIEELGRHLASSGATTARDPAKAALAAVAYQQRVCQLADGRWLDRLAALEDAVLLHRVTHLERHRSAIRMDPDLSVLSGLVKSPTVWWDTALPGTVILDWVRDRRLDRRHAAPDRFLAIPYGLARSLRPGDMIRAVVAEGSLTFEPVYGWQPPADMAYPEVEAVACELIDGGPSPDPMAPIEIDQFVFELVGRMPDVLCALREPIGAMLHRSGLATHREQVGVPTTPWDRYEHHEQAFQWAEREAWQDERDGSDHDPDDWGADLMMDETLLDQVG